MNFLKKILNLFNTNNQNDISETKKALTKDYDEILSDKPVVEGDPNSSMNDRKIIIIENLCNNLKTGNEKDRLYAINELYELAHENSVPTLILATTDSNETIKSKAKELLQQILPNWRETNNVDVIISDLIQKLNSNNPVVKRSAFNLLKDIHVKALPLLLDKLESTQDASFLLDIVKILGQVKEESKPVISALLNTTKFDNDLVKEETIRTLSKKENLDETAIVQLSKFLENKNFAIRLATLEVFKNNLNKGNLFSKQLVFGLIDNHQGIRNEAKVILESIGSKASYDLIQLINDREEIRKTNFLAIEEKYGFKYKEINAMKLYAYSTDIIANISWEREDIYSEIKKIEQGIITAINLLGKTGINSNNTLNILTDSIRDKNSKIRKSSLKAIVALDINGDLSTPLLLQQFKTQYIEDYKIIIECLNQIRKGWASEDQAQPILNYLIDGMIGPSTNRNEIRLALKKVDVLALKNIHEHVSSEPLKESLRKELGRLIIEIEDGIQSKLD